MKVGERKRVMWKQREGKRRGGCGGDKGREGPHITLYMESL